VATVGYIKAEPGSVVVIPGTVTMSVDIRGVDATSKRRIADNAKKEIEEVSGKRQVKVETQMIYDADPVPLSDRIIATIKETADELGIEALMMPSGAGHDAQQIATFTDAGMIFLPSVEGISHNPQEYTRLEDIVLGTKLLTHVLLKLGGEA
jgi:hydantoinase/carbamoylase family amidase